MIEWTDYEFFIENRLLFDLIIMYFDKVNCLY
jgi:hypothetical protein